MKKVLPQKIKFSHIGLAIALLGIILAVVQYHSLILAEARFFLNSQTEQPAQQVSLQPSEINSSPEQPEKSYIIPLDKQFGLVIPKINVNISVIANVNPFDSKEYQPVLSQGVAHVKDTAFPPQGGNTVIFAHSSDSFYHANRYNSVFYLLNKLETGDKLYLTYQEKLYEYQLIEKSIVADDQLEYMQPSAQPQLTLITCWPPGLTLKRLVAVAELVE